MAYQRTWLEKRRNVETCEQFLVSYDSNNRHRRAERLSLETQVELPVDYCIPNWTDRMLEEAGNCFMNGLYTGCILTLAAGVEYGLGELCPEQAGGRFDKLIKAAIDCGYVIDHEKNVLHDLRKYRNNMAHSNIGKLAAGKKLQIQQTISTDLGVAEREWSKKFLPQNQDEREIAADLSAEKKTKRIYLRVREAMYDIFDRNPRELKESDARS